jgi:hypothetical protein
MKTYEQGICEGYAKAAEESAQRIAGLEATVEREHKGMLAWKKTVEEKDAEIIKLRKEVSGIPASQSLPSNKRHVLPDSLLNLIGEYGMARTDGVGELEVLHRWETLIRGIKDYAQVLQSIQSPPAPQSGKPSVEQMPEHLREFVEAIAGGFTDTHPHTQDTFCSLCSVNLDDGVNHLPDCLMLRARDLLQSLPAKQTDGSDGL